MYPRILTPLLFALLLLAGGCAASDSESALSSWSDSPARAAILDYVDAATDPGSPDFIPPAERIAVFDNDGCLWAERPFYFQLYFAMDRVRELAPEHPEWRTTQPFQAVLEDDIPTLLESGEHGLLELVMASHGGMTTAEFEVIVENWLQTARHPTTGRPFTEMVYQPMLEVLEYLRDNGFKTFIVSGGGIEFMRVFAEEVYGVPPEQVIGSSIKTAFEMRDAGPVIVRIPEIDFIDDKAGKPIGIHRHIGRRPVAAFGNSDGDLQMLQWTHAGPHRSLCVIIHHTDAKREWAYDRDSHIGRLDKALDEAGSNGWTVVDMKNDWRRIFPD